MENYLTAATYRDWEKVGTPIIRDGKMYQKVKQICDRCCHGVYVSHVENGIPVPHPAYGGVCLKCGGAGFLVKEVRLYTEAEAARLEAAKERAAAKRETERRAKMEAEFENNRKKWLEKNQWTPEGKTYVVAGDSYSIKDELKEHGFYYDPVLRWHKADPGEYKDRCVEVNLDDVIEMSAWGQGHYLTSAQSFVNNLLNPKAEDEVPSEWIGEVGQRLPLTVTLVRKGYCTTRFGGTNIYGFKDAEGNVLTWFSTVVLDKEVGDTFKIKATIKAHDEYKGTKQTLITRAKEM